MTKTNIERELILNYGISTYIEYVQGVGYKIYYGSLDIDGESFLVEEDLLGPACVKDAIDIFIKHHPELLL